MLKRIIVILVALACAAGGIWWLYDGKRQPSDLLTLYGNVDIRQVDVGFRVGGRVTELFKEEGDAVKTGERLARLDAKPYEEVFDQAAAQLSMQEIELRKMVAGYRTEDIEQARATLSGAQAVYANAASNLRRVERLRQQNAVSQQSLDEARASYGDALSRRNAAREQLQLMESGYRSEDVERQKAAVEAARAELARATTNLQDTELFAPQDGVVLTRVHEIGAVVQGGQTVYTVTLNNPVWIRAYVTQPNLGNIRPGQEVILPSYAFSATATVFVLAGAKLVFVDIRADTMNIDETLIEDAITEKTKAIVPVHYAGAPADIDAIRAIGERYGIAVIEDAAHAVGTYYKGRHIGAKGTAIFSFHAIKNITCAEGGLIVTDNENLARQLRMLKFHGLGVDAYDRQTWGRAPQAEVLTPGYKYNLTDINAAIALTQLAKLEHLNTRRREIALQYQQALAALPFQPLSLPAWPHVHAWHLFIIRVDEQRCGISRNALMEALKERGIGTGLHFRAAHTQKYYRERFPTLSLPNTEWNSERICSLPLFPDMTTADADRVITALQQLAGQ